MKPQNYLTPDEAAELARLEKKRKSTEQLDPLTEHDLKVMEDTVADAYTTAPLQELSEFWERWCKRLKALSNHNARLIAEVRRLNNVKRSSQ